MHRGSLPHGSLPASRLREACQYLHDCIARKGGLSQGHELLKGQARSQHVGGGGGSLGDALLALVINQPASKHIAVSVSGLRIHLYGLANV